MLLRSHILWVLTLGSALMTSCSSGTTAGLVPVSGIITVDGIAGASVSVEFLPQGATKGNGGIGMTDSAGKYVIETPQGEKGLLPGEYKVVLSRKRGRDGSIPDPKIPPIEAQAAETLPAKFSDPEASELKTNVSPEKQSHDFSVQTLKKK